jgi:hypothetical protein
MKTSKQIPWLVSASLLGIILFWDILFRVLVLSNQVSTQAEYPELSSVSQQRVSAQELESIMDSYSEYDKPEAVAKPIAPVPKGMSEQQQRQQSGALSRLFDGDYEYRLSGVFWDSSYFAILIKTHVETKDAEEIKLRIDDLLGEYRVQAISQFNIEFAREAQKVSLPMFLVSKPEV